VRAHAGRPHAARAHAVVPLAARRR
jgi:hypothetical protein